MVECTAVADADAVTVKLSCGDSRFARLAGAYAASFLGASGKVGTLADPSKLNASGDYASVSGGRNRVAVTVHADAYAVNRGFTGVLVPDPVRIVITVETKGGVEFSDPMPEKVYGLLSLGNIVAEASLQRHLYGDCPLAPWHQQADAITKQLLRTAALASGFTFSF